MTDDHSQALENALVPWLDHSGWASDLPEDNARFFVAVHTALQTGGVLGDTELEEAILKVLNDRHPVPLASARRGTVHDFVKRAGLIRDYLRVTGG